jgi:TolB-like protein/Tfp pilus assembly protein PilF
VPLGVISELPSPSTHARNVPRSAVLVSLGLLLILISLSVRVPFIHRPMRTRIQSIVVLPLENISGDPSQQYFADGMTDALITNLARLGSIRVISRTSSMRYKDSHKTLPEIARELDVDAVVEGTVTRSGRRVRINAQLIDARNDRHLWAEVYERDVQDVVELQGDLATAIIDRLATRMVQQSQMSAQRQQINPEAYESYLKGRYFWNKRTKEGFLKSIEFFEDAVAKQPDYAQGYAGLSDAYALLGMSRSSQVPRSEAMARARAAALKALEIDDTVAEAHTSLASVSMVYDWNWSLAEKEFRRAIELDPDYATAHHWYAFYLASQAKTEEAVAEIRTAQKLDPLSIIINADLAHILYFSHRYDEAIAQSRRTLEMDPNFPAAHVSAGLAYLGKQQFSESIAELETAVRVSHDRPDTMAFLGVAYAQAGRKEEAQRLIEQIAAATRDDPLLKVAWIYAALGDRNQAFAWVEKVYPTRTPEFYTLKVLPVLDPLRSDARFKDLIRRVGLPQ